jgi:hypothetical protein
MYDCGPMLAGSSMQRLKDGLPPLTEADLEMVTDD